MKVIYGEIHRGGANGLPTNFDKEFSSVKNMLDYLVDYHSIDGTNAFEIRDIFVSYLGYDEEHDYEIYIVRIGKDKEHNYLREESFPKAIGYFIKEDK